MKKKLSLLSLMLAFGLAVGCQPTTSSSPASSEVKSSNPSSVVESSDSESSSSIDVVEDTLTVTKKSDVIYEKGTTIDWSKFVTYSAVVNGETVANPVVTASAAVNGTIEVTFTSGELTDTETFDIYYAVDSVEGWAAMNDELDAYYALTADIDFTDGGFVTIGHSTELVVSDHMPIANDKSFSGVFDGNGYALKNAKLSGLNVDLDGVNWAIADVPHYAFGHFGVISGTVRNFEIIDAYFGSINYSGLIASMVSETGKVNDVVVVDSTMYNWYGNGSGLFWKNLGTVENVYMTGNLVEQNPAEDQGDADLVKLYFTFNSGTIKNITSNSNKLQVWDKVDENFSSFRLTQTTTPYASDVTGTVENVKVFADWEVNEGNIVNSFTTAKFSTSIWSAVAGSVTLIDNNILA